MRGVVTRFGWHELRTAVAEFLDCEFGFINGSTCLRWRDRAGCLRQDAGREPSGSHRGRPRPATAQVPSRFCSAYSLADRTGKSSRRGRTPQIRTAASSIDGTRARRTRRVVYPADEAARLCAYQADSGSLFSPPVVQEGEKDELERTIAKCTSVQGANCAASEASMANRLILASLGIVPRRLDIC